ncbi:MAG TPA: hypothetical protein VGW34_11290 [Allosphingosinicella sp.]|nr:hypothetical protein [Allosphingosinicella sp.]
MPAPVDLATFKPNSARDFGDAILSHVVPVLGSHAKQGLKELESHIRSFAAESFATADDLASGRISAQEADYLMRMQQSYLNNILRLAAFLPYVLAQAVLDTATKVARAAIRNWTGIDLGF